VLPKPVAGFNASNVCLGESIKFSNTTTISPSSTTVNYFWDFGDGNTSLVKEPTYLYTKAGIYTVKLIAEAPGLCSDEVTKQVTVSPRAVAKIAMKGSCQNRAVQFSDSSAIASGKIASRIWSFGDGNATSALANPTYTYKQPGIYTIKLKVTTDNGCSDSTTRTLTVTSTPVAGFTASSVCQGEAVSFTNTSVAPSGKYLWYFGDGDTSSQTSPSHIYTKSGTFKAYLAVLNPGGCSDTMKKDVVIKALPSAKFSISIDTARNAVFTPNEQGHSSYFWKFGDGNSSTNVIPGYKYSKDGSYKVSLKVTGSNGCSSEYDSTINISATSGIFAQTAPQQMKVEIAPNPFLHSTLVSYNLEKAAKVKVSVYDISGKEIAVITDQKQTQGKYAYQVNGDDLKMNAGIYLLRIIVDDKLITKQIIRLK
jgi:PKD repeat protein